MMPASGATAAQLGRHLLADLGGIEAESLRDAYALERLLRAAATAAGARILGSHFHSFGERDGVTGVVLLAESHLSIHTWPESGTAVVDVFMCGRAQPERALTVMLDGLRPRSQRVDVIARGAV